MLKIPYGIQVVYELNEFALGKFLKFIYIFFFTQELVELLRKFG